MVNVDAVRTRAEEKLSPPVVRLLIATVLNATGTGAVFLYLFVYLHDVRGFAEYRAGLVLATTGIVTLLVNLIGGSLVDRIGPRRQMYLASALQALGNILYLVARREPMAFAAAVINGAGFGLFQPANGSMMTSLTSGRQRATVSAYNRAALNLGVGLGGVVGGFVVDKLHPSTYDRLFSYNVLTFVVFSVLIASIAVPARVDESHLTVDRSGYRAVLSDRFFVRLLISDLAIALGFSFAFEMMPGFASDIGLRERVIGLLFLASTLVIVIVQVPSVRLFRGRSRMRSLGVMNALFAVGFAAMLGAVGRSLTTAIVLIGVAQVIFGLGECVLGAVRQPLTSDLAPPRLVGRYFGLAGMAFQTGMAMGKAIGGFLLGVDHRLLWSVALSVSVLGVLGSLRLDHRIRPDLRLTPA